MKSLLSKLGTSAAADECLKCSGPGLSTYGLSIITYEKKLRHTNITALSAEATFLI